MRLYYHTNIIFSSHADEVPDNLPFPDGEEVGPEIKVETLPGNLQPLSQISSTPVAKNRI